MSNIHKTKFAIASGLTSVVVYLGCYLIMAILGKEGIVNLSNLLFHGMDFSSIVRMNIPLGETLLGAVASFIFWGFIGYVLIAIYNKISVK